MEHLGELRTAAVDSLEIIIAHNSFYPCSQEQESTLEKFAAQFSMQLITFDLVKDKGETAMRTVENVLRNGKGISELSPFVSLYFKKPIEELNL